VRGVVAAGSQPTAEAAVQILRAGGNAVDAAVAACFATSASEPVLTSLAGAGAMTVHLADRRDVTVCDFFANAPGLQPSSATPNKDIIDFFDVELDFGPTRQRFHIGAGAAAVPAAIPGLCSAHERWGRMPLAEVLQPACQLLREGVKIGPFQAYAIQLLRPILTVSTAGKDQFCTGRERQLVGEGDLYRLPALVTVLEDLARGDWRRYYRQTLGEQMLAQFGPDAGGLLTAADLDSYQVHFREPLEIHCRGARIFTNPKPATGGQMVALMLRLLDAADISTVEPRSLQHMRVLASVMRVADTARKRGWAMEQQWQRCLDCLRALLDAPLGAGPAIDGGPASTTHISVIDADGNAAAVTFSFGEGNGNIIDGTGIMMNNLMGEEDLFPNGFHTAPAGSRLSTMMAPTIVIADSGDILALGSGGANRIRTALTQVMTNVLCHDYNVEHAVCAGRIHFEAGVLNAETYELNNAGADLDQLGAEQTVRFDRPNLFFGGVHLVRRCANGHLEGAGDPRRDGACLIV